MLKKHPDRWSHKYISCVKCGKVDDRHRAKGFCQRCYARILMKEYNISYKREHRFKTTTGFKYSEATRPKSKFCELCNRECNTVLDHCHRRNIFRGWLCHQCNTALGLIKDSVITLNKMIQYLNS